MSSNYEIVQVGDLPEFEYPDPINTGMDREAKAELLNGASCALVIASKDSVNEAIKYLEADDNDLNSHISLKIPEHRSAILPSMTYEVLFDGSGGGSPVDDILGDKEATGENLYYGAVVPVYSEESSFQEVNAKLESGEDLELTSHDTSQDIQ